MKKKKKEKLVYKNPFKNIHGSKKPVDINLKINGHKLHRGTNKVKVGDKTAIVTIVSTNRSYIQWFGDKSHPIERKDAAKVKEVPVKHLKYELV